MMKRIIRKNRKEKVDLEKGATSGSFCNIFKGYAHNSNNNNQKFNSGSNESLYSFRCLEISANDFAFSRWPIL